MPGQARIDLPDALHHVIPSDSEILIYDTDGSLAEVVGPAVAKVVELIKKRTQKIIGATTAALAEFQPLEMPTMYSLLDVVSTLIH
jgi:hypothetical protein